MKIKLYDIKKKEIGERELPVQFNEELRPDLIKRAVLAIMSNKRQPYGAKPGAGMRQHGKLSRRRRDFKGSYGIGISRVPRKILSGKGSRWNWVGAVAPGTVGGRQAHPPKAEKVWAQKINKKERRKAIRSAISATVLADVVKERGHNIPADYPFIIDSEIESVGKTKDIKEILCSLGLKKELERVAERKIRSGKGKTRGRKYIGKKGPLIVVSKDCRLIDASKNIPGIDVVNVKNLNAELLAPGTKPGRITLWTDKAIEIMEKENIFLG